jgi:hypothetical protein
MMLSRQYFLPLATGLILQIFLFIATFTALDLGPMNFFYSIALLVQWIETITIFIRRPMSPTKGDIRFLKFGIILLWIISADLLRGVLGFFGISVSGWLGRSLFWLRTLTLVWFIVGIVCWTCVAWRLFVRKNDAVAPRSTLSGGVGVLLPDQGS